MGGWTWPLMLVKRPLVSQIVGEKSWLSKFSTTPLVSTPPEGSAEPGRQVQGALALGGGLSFASVVVYSPAVVIRLS